MDIWINDDIQRDQVIENIGYIIFSLPKNSIIIFIDQPIGTYKNSTDKILERIQSKAKEKKRDLSILQSHHNNQFSCREINKKIPEMVNNYLFYTGYQSSAEANGLILNSNRAYSSLIIERQ